MYTVIAKKYYYSMSVSIMQAGVTCTFSDSKLPYIYGRRWVAILRPLKTYA